MTYGKYPTRFWVLCAGSFFFFGSFNMVVPELPSVLEKLGGGEHKGLIISLFTLTAMLSRPFSGRLSDTIGRVPVMIFGSLVCVICSIIYPFTASVNGFLLLRFFHGFSTGFSPTGFTSYSADIIPPNRRGEAMGLLSVFGTLGMAGSPAVGDWLARTWSLDVMFYGSAVFAMIAVIIYVSTTETLYRRQRFKWSHFKIGINDIYDPLVLVPGIVMLLTSFSYGSMLTLVPDLSDALGIGNKGLIFMIFSTASLLIRIVAGTISDRFGRPVVLKISAALIAVSMVVTGSADAPWMLWIGGILYGLANGMNSPTLFAWATDLGNPKSKGRAFATLYIAMEFGIGLGALVSGYIFADDRSNFLMAFFVGSLLSFLALVFLYLSTEGKSLKGNFNNQPATN